MRRWYDLGGIESVVEIESEWTGRKRERMGIVARVKLRQLVQTVPTLSPKTGDKGGAPRSRGDLDNDHRIFWGKAGPPALAENVGDYSIAGAFDIQNGVGKFLGGNDVGNILFGDASEGVAGLLVSDGGSHSVTGGVGTVGTMGRRTSSVFDLNLAGTPGGTKGGIEILGKTGATKVAGFLTGLAELKAAIDIGLTGAEAIGCAIHN